MLRVFSNATASEIACFSAVITNGVSLSQPAAVGSIMGVATLVAAVASFATAIYGENASTVRTHYAHSLSLWVVFAVYHHVYYLGALSMNWPSVLPAWCSNFGWAAGMIRAPAMQASINRFLGSNLGNTSVVGAANLGSSDNTAGGYQISQVYKRSLNASHFRLPGAFERLLDAYTAREEQRSGEQILKRSLENVTTGFDWYGSPVTPGLPLPGNFTGFAGTLSYENIPASNAFLTGLCWLLILIAAVAGCIAIFKGLLELASRRKWMHADRLALFRKNWIGVVAMATARILFIAFFMMTFLALFQFVYRGAVGGIVLAVLTFLVFLGGFAAITFFSCYYRVRDGKYASVPDRLHVEMRWVLRYIPWLGFSRESVRKEQSRVRKSLGSVPWKTITYTSFNPDRLGPHDDKPFLMRYGWLTARFRKSRWWFASVWLTYELIRACFYGGAAGHPSTQVFGLLAVEIIAFIVILNLKPFEGARLNAIMVYLLGLSKVLTVALSAAFHPLFGLDRIFATAIGIIVVVIQGILFIVLIVFIFIGAITSYMSLTRNREEFHPEVWAGWRTRYLAHVEKAAADQPRQSRGRRGERPAPIDTNAVPSTGGTAGGASSGTPKSPGFTVLSSRRVPKIEDDDGADAITSPDGAPANTDGAFDPWGSRVSVAAGAAGGAGTVGSTRRASRAASVHSNLSYANLPFGARPHRASWASRDFVGMTHDASRRNSTLGLQGPAATSSQPNLLASGVASPGVASPVGGGAGPSSGAMSPVGGVPSPSVVSPVGGHPGLRGARSSSNLRDYGIRPQSRSSRPQSRSSRPHSRSRAASQLRHSRFVVDTEEGSGEGKEGRVSEEPAEESPRRVS